MYSQEEINKKHLEALARKNKTLHNKTGSSTVNKSSNAVSFSGTNQNSSVIHKQFLSSFKNDSSTKLSTKSHAQGNRYNPIASKPFYGLQNKVSINMFMISPTRFAISSSTYNQESIEICKSIGSRKYDINLKQWNFHINDYEELTRKLLENKNLAVSGIPHNVLKVFRKNVEKKSEDIDISKIEPALIKLAKPFQIEGIKYGLSKGGRVMIADDMGLGKTIQALGIAHYYKDDWPMLIVTPSSIRYQWTEAIIRHLPSVPAQHIHQVTTAKDFIGSSPITIISYDLLSRMIEEVEKKVFGVIIVDESHFLKSYKSMRTQAVVRVGNNAHHIILLSGTPALSRPVELYSQVALLKKDFMPFHDYGKRYCAGEMTQFGWNYNGSSNMTELQELLKLVCLIRRMKSEVLTQLPAKIRQVIILDPQQIKSSREMNQALKSLQNDSMNKGERHSVLLQYYSDTAVVKIPAVCKYVMDLIESGNKFLIFAHHKNMLKAICDLLTSKKKKYIKIDGETHSDVRTELVNKFQSNSDILAAVLSITAANAGLNLTAACLVVFAELSWNPGIMCQAEDRVHRIGQTSNVVIQYLIARNTADDYLWNILQRKMDVLEDVGLNQNMSIKDIEVNDQKTDKNQPLIDEFVKPSTSGQTKKDALEEFLEDDDGFDSIDLDNIALS